METILENKPAPLPPPRAPSKLRSLIREKQNFLNNLNRYKWDESEVVAKAHIKKLENEINDLHEELERAGKK